MDDYIPVTIVKEYIYCPRQAYFKTHLHYEPPTASMRYAKDYWKGVNIREVLKANGIEGEVMVEVPLRSGKLGLVGKADAVLINNGELYIIEAKINVSRHSLFTKQTHILAQSLAYGLMAEEAFKRSLSHLIFINENGSVIKVKVTPWMRTWVLRIIREVKKILENPEPPSPTVNKSRCSACHYAKYCQWRVHKVEPL